MSKKSPLLSHIALDELDWELDGRGLRFVRYADDANKAGDNPRSEIAAVLTPFFPSTGFDD